MSDHFIAINRGKDGHQPSDFTYATSTTAAADFEVRIADVDGQGVAVSRLDTVRALKAFTRLLEDSLAGTTFPPI